MNFSERHLVENEALFRDANQAVKKSIVKLLDQARSEIPVSFYCECASLGCVDRVSLTAKQYESIHKEPDQFVVKPGHEIPKVETVVENKGAFSVVRKHEMPEDLK